MFENLSDRLQDIAHKTKGYGKINEDDMTIEQMDALHKLYLCQKKI